VVFVSEITVKMLSTLKDMYVHYNPVRSLDIEEKGGNKKNNDEVRQ
jgi:hypothetical protein